MDALNRRSFLKGSLGTAAVTMLTPRKGISANDKVVLGIMGTGGRGTYLVQQHLLKRKDVEIAYLCDVNVRQFQRSLESIVSAGWKKPQMIQDFRKMLDDKSVDAIVNATPDHWHALGTIMACQAGKDVYTEKPLSLTAWEGKKMVEAARKYKRIVQVGTQTRSAQYYQDCLKFLASGKIGKVHYIRVYFMMKHGMSPKGKEEPVPNGLDWDMWCGPSELRPYVPGRWWFNDWEYSTGGITGDLVHQIDLARGVVGKAYPKTCNCDGGIYALKDGRNIPDTEIATYQYDDLTMTSESTLWTAYMKKIPENIRDGDLFPDWPTCTEKLDIFGTDGYVLLARHGGGWQAFDNDNKIIAQQYGRQGGDAHVENFINCIRSRQKPIGDVEEGHYSSLLCHLADVSSRAGNKKLVLDPKTEKITNVPEANQYMTKKYRKPWIVPENV